jgi:hypothetical protein
MTPTTPLYFLVLVMHILAGLVGFGSVGITGANAARLDSGRPLTPAEAEAAVRYFRPGSNLVEVTTLLVPAAGLVLIGLDSGRFDLSSPFVWIGMGLWLVAAAAVMAGVIPAEAAIQAHVRDHGAELTEVAPTGVLRATCRRAARAAAVADLAASVALVVMILKPH